MEEFHLRHVINNLYEGFRRDRPKLIEGCPCCVNPMDSQRLLESPLREVPEELLVRYYQKALTTWGDEQDLRYLLPRILELAVQPDSQIDLQTIASKIGYAKWWNWPEREQDALRVFFKAIWTTRLSEPPYDDPWRFEELLEVTASLGEGLEEYLAVLTTLPSSHIKKRLDALVAEYPPSNLRLGKELLLRNSPKQLAQFLNWLESGELGQDLTSS